MGTNFKLQLALFRTYLLNFFYNYSFFWFLRRLILNIARINLGKGSYIHSGVKFFSSGRISIGNNTIINPRCYLDNRKRIIIGNNVNISHDTKIYTLGHDINNSKFKSKGANVVIEDDVCVFAGSMIMPGVKIGKGAVVYPGSIVTKDILPYYVVGGNPAIKKGERSKNLSYKLDYNSWFAI